MFRLAIFILLAALSWQVVAQSDDIETGFRRISADEEQRLRSVLAEPIPDNASQAKLSQHFRAKEQAAVRLNDAPQREAVLRDAVRLAPNSNFRNNLARILLDKGQWAEGNELMRLAVAQARPGDAQVQQANIGCDMIAQNRKDAAITAFAELDRMLEVFGPQAKTNVERSSMSRAASMASVCKSRMERGRGHYKEAIEHAEDAERNARKALELTDPKSETLNARWAREQMAQALATKLQSMRLGGRLADAEQALADYIRLSKEAELAPAFLHGIYATAGNLRFSQREFVEAEAFARKADGVLERLGWSPLSQARVERADDLIVALSGQGKWPQAWDEFRRLDQLAGSDTRQQRRVRLTYDRAVVLLKNGQFMEAARLLEDHVANQLRLLGERHFFITQAEGLQGVALWRSGLAEHKPKALELLKRATSEYMSPRNAEFLENIGYRKERREEIFATYLEAMASTPSEDAVQAIGAADWARSSTVQDALNDAAVRAAASTPALADIVRQEQDARHEIASLRQYLQGAVGSAESPLADVAAQMRKRITQLESERARLQATIKAGFPGFDELVRPTMATADSIARKLAKHQALLMLLPTDGGTYIWAIAPDRPPAFSRSRLTQSDIAKMVARLRKDLDLANGDQAGQQFDSASAYALYAQLLAPVSKVWQGKAQLVVASGGALNQLPLGLLQTQANGGAGKSSPWLIKQAAITQVPSISAWLAIKSLGERGSASSAFMGWGDPAFDVKPNTKDTGLQIASRSLSFTRSAAVLSAEALDGITKPRPAMRYADIPPLPDTADELLAIASTLKANAQQDVLLGLSATRESVMKANANGTLSTRRVLAFATHGLVAGDLPNLNQPALALAASSAEVADPISPLLTMEDVLTLKLNADWVLLSACNTAAADGKADEALSGLARAFFYAGSRNLLVTHWSVESESAKLLTTATMEHYARQAQSPKAESLRQAMLKVMQMPKFEHPAFWAPYALIGDGG